jgi:hypothetical protein
MGVSDYSPSLACRKGEKFSVYVLDAQKGQQAESPHVKGTIVNGVNAGTVALQAAANGAGTLTVQPSYCLETLSVRASRWPATGDSRP